MNNLFRVLSALIAVFVCVGLFVACGTLTDRDDEKETLGCTEGDPAPETNLNNGDETTPFVAPPDAVGVIISADDELLTWYLYETKEETIDFMDLDLKSLGDAASEMSLYYLEDDVSFFLIEDGKIVEAYIEDVWAGSVVGVTTLEDGVQEVYIISRPGDEDDEIVVEEIVDDFIDETEPTIVPEDDETPEQDTEETE